MLLCGVLAATGARPHPRRVAATHRRRGHGRRPGAAAAQCPPGLRPLARRPHVHDRLHARLPQGAPAPRHRVVRGDAHGGGAHASCARDCTACRWRRGGWRWRRGWGRGCPRQRRQGRGAIGRCHRRCTRDLDTGRRGGCGWRLARACACEGGGTARVRGAAAQLWAVGPPTHAEAHVSPSQWRGT